MAFKDLYLLIGAVLAVITLIDSIKRKLGIGALVWAILVFLFWPLARGVYQAVKPLYDRETRHGGAIWQVVRAVILWWTVLMVILSISSAFSVGQSSLSEAQTGAEFLGTTMGLGIGVGVLCGIWGVVTLILFVISAVVKSSIVETGPTGSLARQQYSEK